MKWLNCEKMKVPFGSELRVELLFVVLVAAIILSGGIARADFTFGEPIPLGPAINSESSWEPSISADGLSLYFVSERPGGYGGSDIWVSTRPTTEDNWSEPVNLGPVINGTEDEKTPSVSTDELELYFDISGQHTSFFVSTRQNASDPWGDPVYLASQISGGAHCNAPCISGDGLEVYFASYNRPPHTELYDIYVANRTSINDSWQEPVRLNGNINKSGNDNWPNISADGLVLFFYCGPYRGGYGGGDLWMSRRTTVSDPWQEAVNLGSVINSAFDEYSSTVSSDGSMLYFESGRPGGISEWNIWQAPIVPIVDFNGDGNIDTDDLLIMIENWGTSESLCDIGPMPWGDGVVDIEDLKVFIKYWEQENMPQETDDGE